MLVEGRSRWAASVLVGLFLCMSALEVAGVGAIFWFIKLVMEPELIAATDLLARWQNTLAPGDNTAFLIYVGIGLFLLTALRNGMAAVTIYAQERFVLGRNMALSVRLLETYVRKPYSWFLMQNSADLTKRVINDVWQISAKIILPAVDIAAKTIISISIIAFLLWVDVAMTLSVFAILFVMAGALYAMLQRRLHTVGGALMRADGARFTSLAETLGGMKEIKVIGKENFFLRRFGGRVNTHRGLMVQHRVLAQLPHLALETLAIGALLGVILFSLALSQNPAEIISVASLYAIAGYRIMPAIKSIVRGGNDIRLSQPFLEALEKDLSPLNADGAHGSATPMTFSETIALENVRLRYEGQESFAVDDITLTIKKNRSAAFVGPTGAGKSSLIDLLLGVYEADEGSISIDGAKLSSENIGTWQANVGYVPQQIFLLDDTVRNNIAFGVAPEEIDDEAVRNAARLASIDGFIEQKLADGYGTLVGDRGIRLSGGERQRIGIARALYRNPSLLVLDEATSALDGRTEAVISDAIGQLSRKMALIIIAHRLSTVRNCDAIHLMENGHIADSGTYDELMSRNETFQAMARG